MADIKVNSVSMREKASTLKSIADSIKNYTEDMQKTVNALRSDWEGLASDETRSAFTKYQSHFEEKYQTIINFSKFLEDAANEYEKTEKVNAQGN